MYTVLWNNTHNLHYTVYTKVAKSCICVPVLCKKIKNL